MEIVAGAAGAALGAGIPGVGASLGFSIGVTLYSMFNPPKLPDQDRGRINDLRVQGASHGAMIPFGYGRFRVPGNIVWTGGLEEVVAESRVGGGPSGGGATVKDYSYEVNVDVMICEGPLEAVLRIWADTELIYDAKTDPLNPKWASGVVMDSVEIHLGLASETQATVEVAALGAANVPAYNGLARVVFAGLNLAKWGNRIPTFSFEVRRHSDPTLEFVLEDILKRAGVPAARLDFSAVSDVTVKGFAVNARTEAKALLDTLQSAYFFDVVEVDGSLKAVKRGQAVQGTIEEAWLGSLNGPRGSDTLVQISRQMDADLPKKLELGYITDALDLQTAIQTAFREVGYSWDAEKLEFPLLLGEDEARRIAEVLVYLPWLNRVGFKVTLPPSYLKIAPADLWYLPTDGLGLVLVRVVAISSTLTGHLEVMMVEEDPTIYTQTVKGAIPEGSGGTTGIVEYGSEFVVVDLNALSDQDADGIGLYGAAGSAEPGWGGLKPRASAQIVMEDGITLTNYPFESVLPKGTIGQASTALATGIANVWDRTSVVRVVLESGSLSSATEAAVLNGANLAVLGDEIFQFATATLVGTNTWDLSNLIRGRRGTEWAMAGHQIGDRFWMPDGNHARAAVRHTMRGLAWTFTGQVVGGSPPFETLLETMDGNSRKPYAPCHLKAAASGSNTVLTWVRRVRKGGELVDYTDAPLDEDAEEYDVEVWFEDNLKRTARVTSPTWTYTSAMRATDNVPDGETVEFRVYQFTTWNGLGRGHRASLERLVP